MPIFYYQARDSEDQLISGELQANDIQDAVAEIHKRGLSVESIRTTAPESVAGKAEPSRTFSASPTDAVRRVFREHLGSILERARPTVPALRAFSEEPAAKPHRGELQRLIEIIERGDPVLAEKAFAELPDYWVPLISAAMESNDPGRILKDFLNESQRSDELQRQWRMTLAYPILVLCLAAAVMTFLSVLVIPIFRAIFLEFGLNLPTITAVNLKVAYWIAFLWKYIAAAAIVLIAIVLSLTLRARSRGASTTFLGRLLSGRSASLARLSQFTADLLEAGLSVPDALQVAGLLARRKRHRNAFWRLAEEQLTASAESTESTPPPRLATVVYSLRADLPTASRVRLLREITEVNVEKTRRRLSWTRGFAEPVSIMAIGLLVGVVVISLFIPLVKLVEGLSN